MKRVDRESPLTEARLEHALTLAAMVVECCGAQYIVLYEAVEKELAAVRARNDTRARIRQRFVTPAPGPTGACSS